MGKSADAMTDTELGERIIHDAAMMAPFMPPGEFEYFKEAASRLSRRSGIDARLAERSAAQVSIDAQIYDMIAREAGLAHTEGQDGSETA